MLKAHGEIFGPSQNVSEFSSCQASPNSLNINFEVDFILRAEIGRYKKDRLNL